MGEIIISAQDEAVTTGGGETFAGLASPAFTGTPTAPTAAADTNTTQIATTAYVQTEIGALSANSITEGDTDITISDAGSGTITMTVDGGDADLTITDTLATFANDVTVTGDLTVNGTTTTISTTNTVVSDALLELANGTAGSPVNDSGMVVERGSSDNVFWGWDENTDEWTVGTGSFTGASTGNLTTTDSAIRVASATFSNGNVVLSAGDILPSASSVIQNVGSPTDMWTNMYAAQFHGVATKAQYADLAENYVADADYENGTVLSFGGEHEVTVSTVDGDKRIAGIVSTAPAHLMNSTQTGEFLAAVALSGRAPCNVTGTVRKGDMMVSNGDGTARAEENPQMGQVIGKALEDFDGETGLIEVVVGRL